MKEIDLSTNIGLKITSLIIAIALWFFVILSGRSEISMSIPLVFENIPPSLEIVEAPETVNVSIEGQQRLLKSLKQSTVTAAIDLSAAKGGKFYINVSKSDVKLPKTFVVTDVDPETISIRLERKMKKTVSIKASIIGLPEKGYTISEIRVSPDKVELEGPKSAVSEVYTVKTEPIDINGITADLQYKANLNLSDSLIRKNIQKVEVNIFVQKIK